MDPTNIMDAEGIKKITELTAQQAIRTNELEQDERLQITKKNTTTTQAMLEMQRQEEEARARQARQIAEIQAREKAEADKVLEESRAASEAARLRADEAIKVQEQEQLRAVEVAEQGRLRVVAIEQERVNRAAELEKVTTDQEVQLKAVDRDKVVEQGRMEVANVIRERTAIEQTVAVQEEKIKETREVSAADREKQVRVLAAEAEAQQHLVKDVKAAEAAETAARHLAAEKTTLAEAELVAAGKQAEAKRALAEGVKAEVAAPGLAEAQVRLAQAEAIKSEGLAEAQVLEAKAEASYKQGSAEAKAATEMGRAKADATAFMGEAEAKAIGQRMSAEAEGLTGKFEAMGKMSPEARAHEEFRMALETNLRQLLTSIEAGKEVSRENAAVLAKALESAKIELIGGDGGVFDALTKGVSIGKATGAGIYSEPVEDRTQSLDDAQFYYARLGSLILLKILPYRETAWRGLVFNTMTQQVTRLDAIVEACVQLPEDHGIIFPGGYVLQNGEQKAFDGAITQMRYKRTVLSPNGEDVLYIFYEPDAGQSALLVYNMIQRRVMPPILAHGHARLPDGRMVLFHDETSQPTRVHQMQVWDTPFFSDEYAAAAPAANSAFGRIGNPELVRTISDLFDIARDIEQEDVTVQRYEALAHATRRLFDIHPWITDAVADGLAGLLHDITETAESVLDEFQKVQEIRQQSEVALANASAGHRSLMGRLQPEGWARLEQFVEALHEVSRLRGHLLTIRDMRYIDVAAIDAMVTSLDAAHDQVGAATAAFLLNPKALAPFETRLDELEAASGKAATANQLAEVLRGMHAVAADLDMLSELMAGLKVDDATKRTQVVDAIAALYARLNQAKARTDQRRKTLGSSEAVAQFGAQFALFSQSVANSLGIATTPEKADEQLSRLMVQLEELEGQFGEHEQFLGDILTKREELLEAFESHKQALLDERQRKAASLLDAANRILDGLGRRTERFDNADDLNAFFAGDPLIQKLRDLCARLRDLRDTVKADDIEARIKAARDQAVRGMRDRTELFDEGGNVIKLGPRHRFSVNTQALDLTLLQRGDAMTVHLTGTDFMEPLQDEGLDSYRHYWPVALESESPQLYRGEYLAGQVLDAARRGEEGLTTQVLQRSLTDEAALAKLVRDYAAPRYRDGYEKGIHDVDATQILKALVRLQQGAGALVYLPQARALAVAFWAAAERETWAARINAANAIDALGGGATARAALRPDLIARLNESLGSHDLGGAHLNEAADYLLMSVTAPDAALPVSSVAAGLVDRLEGKRADKAFWTSFTGALKHLEQHPAAAWSLATQAITSLLPAGDADGRFVPEAVAMFLGRDVLKFESSSAPVSTVVEGLLGQHPSIEQGRLRVAVDDFNARYRHHAERFVPGFRDYQALRSKVIAREREAMRLEEFKPKPLTSFVRNRLINDVYLALIGDNLAKQIGTVGEGKRSDLMGLLMLISPPGYGKTTLMEYVANRLGLIFMKVNGPALGHGVRSLDPAQAPDATSRRELEKLNLALEMGSNVMLYVDDIQHTHPEFLQKFISLCDGTRRIEGVWRGQTKTYDMRGKKFAVIMAGNPYTESGEVFKIPDMLANRADIYNLGDVLGGMEATFLLSYIENCLTSNLVVLSGSGPSASASSTGCSRTCGSGMKPRRAPRRNDPHHRTRPGNRGRRRGQRPRRPVRAASQPVRGAGRGAGGPADGHDRPRPEGNRPPDGLHRAPAGQGHHVLRPRRRPARTDDPVGAPGAQGRPVRIGLRQGTGRCLAAPHCRPPPAGSCGAAARWPRQTDRHRAAACRRH